MRWSEIMSSKLSHDTRRHRPTNKQRERERQRGREKINVYGCLFERGSFLCKLVRERENLGERREEGGRWGERKDK